MRLQFITDIESGREKRRQKRVRNSSRSLSEDDKNRARQKLAAGGDFDASNTSLMGLKADDDDHNLPPLEPV